MTTLTRRIEILIGPQGETTVRTRGVAGPSCREASRFLEQALGPRTGEALSAEFFQSVPCVQHQAQRSGQ